MSASCFTRGSCNYNGMYATDAEALAACVPADTVVAYVLNAQGRSAALSVLPLVLDALRSA